MERSFPKTWYTVRLTVGDKDYVAEGEAKMSDNQVVHLKNILGDEKGRVTVSREVAEKRFGNGGGLFVSVSVVCDQSHAAIYNAADIANNIVENLVNRYHPTLIEQLKLLGIGNAPNRT